MIERVRAAALLLLLTGCQLVEYEDTTTVRVRKSAAVSVGVSTPSGGKWLLPAGEKAEGPVEVPDSKPPLTEGRRFARVERMVSGDATIECPSCKGAEKGVLFQGSDVVLDGSPDDVLRWNPGGLGMHDSYKALFSCHRRRGDCPREAISFWLETPQSNVVEVRHRRAVARSHGELTVGWAGIAAGAAMVLGGAGLETGASLSNGSFSLAALVFAVPVTVIGAFFAGVGIADVTAKDTDTRVYPPE